MDSRLKKHPFGFYEAIKKPSLLELKNYYAKKYFQESKSSYEENYSDEEIEFINNEILHVYEAMKKNSQVKRGNFLDVGCGEGYALAFFKNKGFNVRGLDFSSAGVESKNPKYIENLITGDLFELLNTEIKSKKKYEVIWLQNVLEHVIDPVNLMEKLHTLISENGLIIIKTPNDFSKIQVEALDNGLIQDSYWVAFPDHLSYFDSQSLISIAENTGWEVKDILGDFPVDWFLYNERSNYINNPAVGKLAYKAKIQLTNLISKNKIKDILEFRRAIVKIGSGRNITMLAKKK